MTEEDIALFGYSEVFKAILQTIVMRRYDKQRAVWIQGLANTGKTTFVKFMKTIFSYATLRSGGGDFHVDFEKESSKALQVIVMDETDNLHFFAKKQIPQMKLFLEGGGLVTNSKYGSIDLAYADCCVVFASNNLPFDKMDPIDSFALR